VKDPASVDAVPTIKVPGNTHFKTNMQPEIRLSRRSLLLGAAATTTALSAVATPVTSARGLEGQRRPDQGNGTYLNPIMAGDHPDPSILKDGEDYYLTFSSFDSYPGIVIWTSRDLVNWKPVTAALRSPIGSVWAPELVKHKGRYYVYIPARFPSYHSNYVIHADKITGPWSEPVDLKLPNHIDPGHAVGEDGKRYLFLSGGDRVRLTDDGLATDGPVEHVYDPWHYPPEWDVEAFSPEGPKVLRHNDWFYLVTAVGGTAGPPTGHMVIAARSRSIHGPWENAPGNPLVRTQSASEKWWSRGHATVFEGPNKTWWMIYHGYENGFWTLGRQTLLDPVEWTADGWFAAKGGDLSRPLPKATPAQSTTHGLALSDDFSTNKFGIQWSFYDPKPDELQRVRIADHTLFLKAKGTGPTDTSPVCFIAGDPAYEFEADLEIDEQARAGLLLFYSRRLYCGLGFDNETLIMHRYGLERNGTKPAGMGRHLRIRIKNDRHIVTIHTRVDAGPWTKFSNQFEVSGYHHNVAGDFLSLRPAIYAAGKGEVRVRDVRYTAL
jgi:xylan 1,4-beta-xylosidase